MSGSARFVEGEMRTEAAVPARHHDTCGQVRSGDWLEGLADEASLVSPERPLPQFFLHTLNYIPETFIICRIQQ